MAVQSGPGQQGVAVPRIRTHPVAGVLVMAAYFVIVTPLAILARAVGLVGRASGPVWRERGLADPSRRA